MLSRFFFASVCILASIQAFPSPAPAQAFQRQLDHAETLVQQLVVSSASQQKILAEVRAAETSFELAAALGPIILADIAINPESRVKIAARPNRIRLDVGKPQWILLKVENLAGSTAPLQVTALDLALAPPRKPSWLEVQVVHNDWTSNLLSGLEIEYKVVELTLHEAGLHEVRLAAEAGQGTQDLGFRATTDLLLDGLESNRVE